MDIWGWLLDGLVVLGAALVLGTLAERLKQSAIIGYILAGVVVGPHGLGWIASTEDVQAIAELGLTLLLFSLGLEFSFSRLIKMGPITYIGGTLQVCITTLIGSAILIYLGFDWRPALTLGMIVSLSSTASVVRTLMDDFSLEALYGRNAVGMLLLQDLALLFLALVTLALTGHSSLAQAAWKFGEAAGLGLLLFGGLYLLTNKVLPKLLGLRQWSQNRDLPILLAVVVALGSAWAAHQANLSPSIGAFLAGMLLANSPFAVQIRADIAALRTLLLTLFFASIGMWVAPDLLLENALPVAVTVGLIVIGKPLIVWGVIRVFCVSRGQCLATGVCLGQVGEFSIMLANLALAGAIIDDATFQMVILVSVITLLLTPYMVRVAPVLAGWTEDRWPTAGHVPAEESSETAHVRDRILLVGYGPAGQRVSEELLPHFQKQLVVLDINPDNAKRARRLGLEFHIGDSRQREILEHAHIYNALAVIITVPDPATCRQVIPLCRNLAPDAKIFVRARYHVFLWEFMMAGAEIVIDEEDQVGQRLADEILKAFVDPLENPSENKS